MQLGELLRGVETLAQSGVRQGLEIRGLHYDSREIRPDYLFVAMKGETSDGNRYIDAALAQGAVAIVSDAAQPPRAGLPWIRVAHGRRALGILSANFYCAPASRLAITAVTGTNGKTTTAFLLSQLLGSAGRGRPVLVGTVEYRYAGRTVSAPFTTPESLELNRIFAEATDRALPGAATEAVMEVSSHALAQERVFGIHFDVAVFTNLTQDHLDYHGSMENYFAAKAKLFAGCGSAPPRVAIINHDDEYGRRLIALAASAGSELMTYGIDSGEVRAREISLSASGMNFRLSHAGRQADIHTPLIGKVNVYNLLAASAAALGRGVDLETLRAAVPHAHGAPGRFERVDCGQPFAVVVDYAHTDDALRNLTALAREFVAARKQPGRVLTLFGCGGDRDRGKRSLMAQAAGRGSDFVVLTSDNPRSEDPRAIIADALPGLVSAGARYSVEPDRRAAIALILGEARAGDIVLIAGKGHEKVQLVAAERIPFDDVAVARAALEAAGYSLLAGAHGARR